MASLANGLSAAKQYEDTLSVQEAELAMLRRVGTSEGAILGAQGNLASTYQFLGRSGQAHSMRRDVYFGCLKLYGEEHRETLREAVCYSSSLLESSRFEEAKPVLRKMTPLARRVLGGSDVLTLTLRMNYAKTLYKGEGATLDDLREATSTLEDLAPTARRVLGGGHPLTGRVEVRLREARAALAARDGGVSAIRDAVEAMTPGGA